MSALKPHRGTGLIATLSTPTSIYARCNILLNHRCRHSDNANTSAVIQKKKSNLQISFMFFFTKSGLFKMLQHLSLWNLRLCELLCWYVIKTAVKPTESRTQPRRGVGSTMFRLQKLRGARPAEMTADVNSGAEVRLWDTGVSFSLTSFGFSETLTHRNLSAGR